MRENIYLARNHSALGVELYVFLLLFVVLNAQAKMQQNKRDKTKNSLLVFSLRYNHTRQHRVGASVCLLSKCGDVAERNEREDGARVERVCEMPVIDEVRGVNWHEKIDEPLRH